jgi:hypothetical protein
MKTPFKTVMTEYFEDYPNTTENEVIVSSTTRRIRVMTTTQYWIGSDKAPIISTISEYL